jgi:FHA domain/DUF1707 SHOCT-like domain
MTADTLPPAVRASDADRDEVIHALREASADGRISHDTFLARVDLALRAQGISDLAGLLRDLAPPRRGPQVTDRILGWWSGVSLRLQDAWRAPRLAPLVLPRGQATFTIGRSPECDLVIPNRTVSWQHAELWQAGGEWQLADLGSTNGTRVNGWQARSAFPVRPGDRVTFGRVAFRLTDQP